MLHPARRLALSRAFQSGDSLALARAWLEALRRGQDPDEAMPEPLADEWREAVVDGLSALLSARAGSVYVAAYLPYRDVHKVGQTALSPQRRIRSLRTAGVLAPLELVHAEWVPDRHAVESRTHAALRQHRVEREFFHAPYPLVRAALVGEALRELKLWEAAAGKLGPLADYERAVALNRVSSTGAVEAQSGN